jgi:hypothetical protein
MSSTILHINKYFKDPKWSEVIKLYSGLFDDGNERMGFIIDLSENDISLAADCKNESIISELELKGTLTESSFQKALYFKDHYGSAKAFEALLKLDASNQVVDILASISVPSKIHKNSIEEFISNSSVNQLLIFLANVINNDNKQNKNVLNWTFKAIKGRKVYEVTNEIEKFEAVIEKLKYVKNRSELLKTLFIGNFLLVFILRHLKSLAYEITTVLLKKRQIDKGQYKTAGKLIEYYSINESFLDTEISGIEKKVKLSEQQRLEKSNQIKKSMLNQIYRCKVKKMSKNLDGRPKNIPVAILDIPQYPRGNQIIPISALPLIEKCETGSIIFAKVVEIKFGQGDIILMPIESPLNN